MDMSEFNPCRKSLCVLDIPKRIATRQETGNFQACINILCTDPVSEMLLQKDMFLLLTALSQIQSTNFITCCKKLSLCKSRIMNKGGENLQNIVDSITCIRT